MKILIKKHTKVRRPKSGYITRCVDDVFDTGERGYVSNHGEPDVIDVPYNWELRAPEPWTPLYKQQKGDWNDKYIAKQFNDSMAELFGVDPNPPKPSLLTKLKNRFKK